MNRWDGYTELYHSDRDDIRENTYRAYEARLDVMIPKWLSQGYDKKTAMVYARAEFLDLIGDNDEPYDGGIGFRTIFDRAWSRYRGKLIGNGKLSPDVNKRKYGQTTNANPKAKEHHW